MRWLWLAGLPSLALLIACPQDELCEAAADCAGGQLCVEGVCRQACNSGADCGDMQICVEGACLPPLAVDGGVADAESSDAVTADSAGSTDAVGRDRVGADLAPLDAVVTDAAAGQDRIAAEGVGVDVGPEEDAGRQDGGAVADAGGGDSSADEDAGSLCGTTECPAGHICDDPGTSCVPAPFVSLALALDRARLPLVGSFAVPTLYGVTADGTRFLRGVADGVQLLSEDEAVIQVVDGRFTAVGAGEAQVSAYLGGLFATLPLAVRLPLLPQLLTVGASTGVGNDPRGLCLSAEEDRYFLVLRSGSRVEVRDAALTTVLSEFEIDEMDNPEGCTVDAVTGELFILDRNRDRIFGYSATGTLRHQIDVSLGGLEPWGIALDPFEDLFVIGNKDGQLFRVPRGGGEGALIYDGGDTLKEPSIDIDRFNGQMVVYARETGLVVFDHSRGPLAGIDISGLLDNDSDGISFTPVSGRLAMVGSNNLFLTASALELRALEGLATGVQLTQLLGAEAPVVVNAQLAGSVSRRLVPGLGVQLSSTSPLILGVDGFAVQQLQLGDSNLIAHGYELFSAPLALSWSRLFEERSRILWSSFGSSRTADVVHLAAGDLLAGCDPFTDRLYTFTRDGTVVGSVDLPPINESLAGVRDGITSAMGLAHDPISGDFFIADSADDRVYRINAVGQLQGSFNLPTDFRDVTGLTWGDGELLAVDDRSGLLGVFEPGGALLGSQDLVALTGVAAVDVAYDVVRDSANRIVLVGTDGRVRLLLPAEVEDGFDSRSLGSAPYPTLGLGFDDGRGELLISGPDSAVVLVGEI